VDSLCQSHIIVVGSAKYHAAVNREPLPVKLKKMAAIVR
jgi:hypothetical protein